MAGWYSISGGEVMGSNDMILVRFGGARFAGPIRFGHEVLRGSA